MRIRRLSALLATALLALSPRLAAAEPGKAALVIGNGTYQGGASLTACGQSARDVATWLRQRGFAVEEAIDATSVAMRSAIGSFVTQASGAPQRTAIIYVCSYAAVSNQRLFLLPSDSDPHQPTRLETQGIIIKALLNTLGGTNGVLFADLGVAPDRDAADAIDALQTGLPTGAHFAIVARNDAGVGSLGRALPGLLGGAGQDWGRLAAVFQAQNAAGPERLAVFAPPQGPMSPVQDVPAAVVAAAPPAPAPTPAPAEEPHPVEAAPVPVATTDQPSPEAQAAASEPAAVAPAAAPAAAPEAVHPPAGAPLQLVPPPRPAEAAPQVADIGPADQQQPVVPEAPAPSGEVAPPPPAAPAVAAPVQATQPPARPTSSRSGRIQAALARRGFYSGTVSGRMDSRTREAIRAFQASLGDPSSGVLTQIQIAKLLNIGQ
ncbi:MAG: caspase family protein [Inquilinus limosus]|uniref:Caspase family protein n=1 Tax=Inquilinus limosus TaxID=171674 RepID=A0A952FLR3_9PROT|nr:caspase family protein [Inquilinus limosus]